MSAESEAQQAMKDAANTGRFLHAAQHALDWAEMVGARSPEGALVLTLRAQVYATLHHARMTDHRGLFG